MPSNIIKKGGFREGQATVKKEHQDSKLTTPRKLELMYEHQETMRQRYFSFTWHGWRYLGPGGARKSGTMRHTSHDVTEWSKSSNLYCHWIYSTTIHDKDYKETYKTVDFRRKAIVVIHSVDRPDRSIFPARAVPTPNQSHARELKIDLYHL